MSCPAYSQANSTLTNACAIQQSAITSQISSALKTCCTGGNGVQTTADGCFAYCNITSSIDALHWSYCLLDNLNSSTISTITDNDLGDCSSNFTATSNSSSLPPGNVATTWVPTGQVITFSLSGSAFTTQTFTSGGIFATGTPNSNGSTSTTRPGNLTSTTRKPVVGSSTVTGSLTSTSAPAASTSKPSKAANGVSFSRIGAVAMVGLAVFSALV